MDMISAPACPSHRSLTRRSTRQGAQLRSGTGSARRRLWSLDRCQRLDLSDKRLTMFRPLFAVTRDEVSPESSLRECVLSSDTLAAQV
jgi:hypothetical protein